MKKLKKITGQTMLLKLCDIEIQQPPPVQKTDFKNLQLSIDNKLAQMRKHIQTNIQAMEVLQSIETSIKEAINVSDEPRKKKKKKSKKEQAAKQPDNNDEEEKNN